MGMSSVVYANCIFFPLGLRAMATSTKTTATSGVVGMYGLVASQHRMMAGTKERRKGQGFEVLVDCREWPNLSDVSAAEVRCIAFHVSHWVSARSSAYVSAPNLALLKNCTSASAMYWASPPGTAKRSSRYSLLHKNNCDSSLHAIKCG